MLVGAQNLINLDMNSEVLAHKAKSRSYKLLLRHSRSLRVIRACVTPQNGLDNNQRLKLMGRMLDFSALREHHFFKK